MTERAAFARAGSYTQNVRGLPAVLRQVPRGSDAPVHRNA